MTTRTLSLVLAANCVLLASTASAHYLWVTLDAKASSHGTAKIYFEGGPSAGDGRYNDPFVKRGKTWIRTLASPAATELEVADIKEGKKRWLSAKLNESGPRSIDSYGKWGVYKYNEGFVLLHYYARNLDIEDHDDLHELGRASQMALDIVPHDNAGEMQLNVVWKGEPVVGRPVSVRGPKGFKASLKTDEKGAVSFKVGGGGRYTFRTNVEQKESGTFEGQDYTIVRHHATLLLKLPLKSD